MNKITAILVAVCITFAMSVVPAVSQQVTTSTTVATGGGSSPIIKAKWEQDLTTSLEDGDPEHKVNGAAFLPPCVYQGQKTVEYYAIVTDAEDSGDLKQVWADVYHPDGSFKYEVPFAKIASNAEGKNKFIAAVAAGLVTFNPLYTQAEIIDELDKGTARVWKGTADLDYEQPGGNYRVVDIALDFNDNPSPELTNTFNYVPTSCFSLDNTAINYGSVSIGKRKVISGDTIFQSNDGKMTVRNLGNMNMQLQVWQDDMNFGKDVTGKWNVDFDARVGHIVDYVIYDPIIKVGDPTPANPAWTTVPGVLPHSQDDEVDLSILVKKGLGSHTGGMYFRSIIV